MRCVDFFLLTLPCLASAFLSPMPLRHTRSSSRLTMSVDGSETPRRAGVSRSDLVQGAGLVGLGVGLGLFGPSNGRLQSVLAGEDAPVVVLGARGKTGRLIVKELLGLGKSVRAVSHSSFEYDAKELQGLSGSLQYAQGDVTKPDTLPAVVEGASAVIFASSASKSGGDAAQVDFKGVENVAKACIDAKVPRYVIISSGAVSRPDSLGYKITNIFGGIMAYKLQGEDRVRVLYANAPTGVSYTIVRPGGLSTDPPLGVKQLEINQGDTIIGEISRADVADACVNAVLAKKPLENVTFEIYETRRRTVLEGRFPAQSGYERHGDTWEEVFAGLVSDERLGIVPKA